LVHKSHTATLEDEDVSVYVLHAQIWATNWRNALQL